MTAAGARGRRSPERAVKSLPPAVARLALAALPLLAGCKVSPFCLECEEPDGSVVVPVSGSGGDDEPIDGGFGDAMVDGESFLRTAEQTYHHFQIPVWMLYTRLARAHVMGGPKGHALLEQTSNALHEQGVVDVERWSRMKLPGFQRPR